MEGFWGISPATLHCRDANSGLVRARIPLRPRRRDCHVCFTPGFFALLVNRVSIGMG